MNKNQIILACFFLSIMVITSSFNLNTLAERDEISDEWDFEGIQRVSSEEQRLLIYDPTDPEYEDPPMNESVGGYDRPQLYFQIMGFDTNDDQLLDHYYGFYGMCIYYDLEDFYNYTVQGWELFWVVINAKWRLRIPEGSDAKWEVLYYPDPYYDLISVNLLYKVPIYYINFTKYDRVSLQYRIDLGLNYTIGNFTTFSSSGMPLNPDIDDFPGYRVTVPLYTATLPSEFLVQTGFFDSAVSFIMIISLSFGLFYKIRKRRRRMR